MFTITPIAPEIVKNSAPTFYHKDAKFEGARLVGFEVEAFSVKHTYKGKWGVDASLTSVPLSPELPSCHAGRPFRWTYCERR